MNAGWAPSYDKRVDIFRPPPLIIYKANIWQSSGVDWKDVKISLSNASPMTARRCALTQSFIDLCRPISYELNEVVVKEGTAPVYAVTPAKAEK